jgi:hypothetical protein
MTIMCATVALLDGFSALLRYKNGDYSFMIVNIGLAIVFAAFSASYAREWLRSRRT